MDSDNLAMEREEHWRQRLLELKSDLKITQAAMADAIGIDPSYLSRLLYPPGKPGRKNLGLDSMMSIRRAYKLQADWFDLPLGSALPSERHRASSSHHFEVREPQGEVVPLEHAFTWPFHLVTFGRLQDLKKQLGPKGAADALRDIDSLLDVVVTKWERVAAHKKRRGA